ncbi:hypothetical protein [Rathayibacter rathayi]|uniref:hypothetical protein n=1 Tax=Rathayibacter rathayi TaxID=33887 RepID=UPI000FD7080B|nr:hypothetical protein [Rathayibacter rathayi]AZZ49064.1 hypothetical protein C1O28_07520 [Rathayibacter rathayi]
MATRAPARNTLIAPVCEVTRVRPSVVKARAAGEGKAATNESVKPAGTTGAAEAGAAGPR